MYLFIFIPTAAGLFLSVLVNYLSDVLPVTRKFSASVCLHCGHTFSPVDYLLLRSCRQCGQRRSLRNWLTLIVVTSASFYIWNTTPVRVDYAVSMSVIAYFALIAVIDIEHRLILHPTSIFGALLGLGVGWLKHGPYATLLGGLIGFLIMLSIYYLGVWFARYRARRMEQAGQEADDEEALGFGDVNLAGVLGLLTGWRHIGIVLLQGILLAGIFGIFMVLFMLIARKYKENALMVFMPYGPFLILSAFLTIFVPNWISIIARK